MSKINAGEIEITLNGETKTLKPTIRAMQVLSRSYGGLGPLREAIAKQDYDAICLTIRHGCNLNDKQGAKLAEQVYENGVTGDLIVPLIKYTAILGNGGRPLDDEPPAGDEGGAEGNVVA